MSAQDKSTIRSCSFVFSQTRRFSMNCCCCYFFGFAVWLQNGGLSKNRIFLFIFGGPKPVQQFLLNFSRKLFVLLLFVASGFSVCTCTKHTFLFSLLLLLLLCRRRRLFLFNIMPQHGMYILHKFCFCSFRYCN